MHIFESQFEITDLQNVTERYINKFKDRLKVKNENFQDAKLTFVPFIELKVKFDINYSYNATYLKDNEYQAAMHNYEISYNQYTIALAQKAQTVDKLQDGAKIVAALVGNPKKPKKPSKDFFEYTVRETSTVKNSEGKQFTPLSPDILPKGYKSSHDLIYIPEEHIPEEHRIYDDKKIRLIFDDFIQNQSKTSIQEHSGKKNLPELQSSTGNNVREYKISYLPIWEVLYKAGSKEIKVYLDEINSNIFSDGINTANRGFLFWTWLSVKHTFSFSLYGAAIGQIIVAVSPELYGKELSGSAFWFIIISYCLSVKGLAIINAPNNKFMSVVRNYFNFDDFKSETSSDLQGLWGDTERIDKIKDSISDFDKNVDFKKLV